jgi:hypothetical protein
MRFGWAKLADSLKDRHRYAVPASQFRAIPALAKLNICELLACEGMTLVNFKV